MSIRRPSRILTIGLAVIGVIILGAAAVVSLFGEDLLWSTLRRDHTAVIESRALPLPQLHDLPPEAWQGDVRHLGRIMRGRLAGFDRTVDIAAFEARVDSVYDLIPELAGAERVLLMAALADVPMRRGIGAGHTELPYLQQPLNWLFYSFYAFPFEDGVWIVMGENEAGQAVGTRIVSMNGVPVKEVLERAESHLSADNRHSRRLRAAAVLSSAGFLEGLGVVGAGGRLELTTRSPDGETRQVVVHPVRLFSLAGLAWGRRLHGSVDTWSPADPRPSVDNYGMEYDESRRLLVLRFNRVSNAADESIEEFTTRLGAFVDAHPVDRFVIDLRRNGGGDNQLLEPLLSLLSGHPLIDRRGVLYTLIGPRTYSAAGAFATALEYRTQTLFAGEPSGFSPNHNGDARPIGLSHSGLIVHVSSRYWQDGGPFDERSWIEPDLRVPLTFMDHFEGRDPVIEAVVRDRPQENAAGTPADWWATRDPPTVSDSSVTRAPSTLRSLLSGRYRFGPFMVMEIGTDPSAGIIMEIRGTGVFARSELVPSDTDTSRLTTSINDVDLLVDASGALSVDWRGGIHSLPRMRPGESVPVELLRDVTTNVGASVDSVVAAFRSAAARGARPDSRVEFLLNGIAYELLSNGRADEAVRLFALQTELFPTVPNTFDSMGDGFLAVGDHDRARAAFQRALAMDPGFAHPREMLEKLVRSQSRGETPD